MKYTWMNWNEVPSFEPLEIQYAESDRGNLVGLIQGAYGLSLPLRFCLSDRVSVDYQRVHRDLQRKRRNEAWYGSLEIRLKGDMSLKASITNELSFASSTSHGRKSLKDNKCALVEALVEALAEALVEARAHPL